MKRTWFRITEKVRSWSRWDPPKWFLKAGHQLLIGTTIALLAVQVGALIFAVINTSNLPRSPTPNANFIVPTTSSSSVTFTYRILNLDPAGRTANAIAVVAVYNSFLRSIKDLDSGHQIYSSAGVLDSYWLRNNAAYEIAVTSPASRSSGILASAAQVGNSGDNGVDFTLPSTIHQSNDLFSYQTMAFDIPVQGNGDDFPFDFYATTFSVQGWFSLDGPGFLYSLNDNPRPQFCEASISSGGCENSALTQDGFKSSLAQTKSGSNEVTLGGHVVETGRAPFINTFGFGRTMAYQWVVVLLALAPAAIPVGLAMVLIGEDLSRKEFRLARRGRTRRRVDADAKRRPRFLIGGRSSSDIYAIIIGLGGTLLAILPIRAILVPSWASGFTVVDLELSAEVAIAAVAGLSAALVATLRRDSPGIHTRISPTQASGSDQVGSASRPRKD